MLRRVALVRISLSEERVASIIRVSRIGVLGVFLRNELQFIVTANIVSIPPIPVTLMMEAVCSSETSVLTRVTRRNIQEDGILLKIKIRIEIAQRGWRINTQIALIYFNREITENWER
jgi:hypothetical protein